MKNGHSVFPESDQGHWILARMGKKVLRPGGKELSVNMIRDLDIRQSDDLVEFAPGLGFTAAHALSFGPKRYTGVEMDEKAVALLRKTIHGSGRTIIEGNAAQSNLPYQSADKVFGEAMLTMQADHRKADIIREAYRILKPGGLYGIHELGLAPDSIDTGLMAEIQKALAISIRLNARPVTCTGWKQLLENHGFTVLHRHTAAMRLLEPGRMLEDEGLLRTLRIGWNILTHRYERKRILEMSKVFNRYQQHLCGVALVARKD